MNVVSETLALSSNHHLHRGGLTNKHSSKFVGISPLAVNNKIRAIQTRKSRIILHSYYDFTDIRPLNPNHPSGITNAPATTTLPKLSPQKLVERSKELRLGRLAFGPNFRPSVLSTVNQQSSIWPSLNSITNSPSGPDSIPNKSPLVHMPDIHQRSNRIPTTARQPLIDQQNTLIPIDSKHKSSSKRKSSKPKAQHLTTSNIQPLPVLPNIPSKQFDQSKNINAFQFYEIPHDDENGSLEMDEEFEEYLQKAMVKCADWLIKYVFDQKYEDIEQ